MTLYVISSNQLDDANTNVVFMPYNFFELPIEESVNIVGHINRLYASGYKISEERNMPNQKLTMLVFKRDVVNVEGDNGIVATWIADTETIHN